MKKILSLLLAAMMIVSVFAVSAFAWERKDYDLRVLTFEDKDYKGGENFAGGKDWTSLIDDPQYGGKMLYGSSGMGTDNAAEAYWWNDENNTFLFSMLSYSWNTYCYWGGGQAISNYVSGEASKYGNFMNQLTVYKKGVEGIERTGGGHNGSNNFAVHYGYTDNSGYTNGMELPYFEFSDGVARVVDHMYVNNICYAVNCYIDGNGLTAKIGPEDWVKLVATGFDKDGKEIATKAEIYLCNGPDNIVTDWTKWDLSVLGEVTRIEFNVTGSSDNGYGFSQPAYFAYDDVAVRFNKTSEEIAAEVEELIDAIGTPITKDSSKAISEAREAYNSLSDEEKALVSNYDSLKYAEKVLAALGNVESDNIHVAGGSTIAIEKGEENPNTGAPAMSMAPAMLVLAAAAFVFKKH